MAVTPRTENPAWHHEPQAVQRFVTDLVVSEMKRLRPGGAALPPLPWVAQWSLDEDGIGLDSLERLTVASALGEALHFRDSGDDEVLLARRRFGEWLEIVHAHLRRHDALLTFSTSGSSGVSKHCMHPLSKLEHEVGYLVGLVPDTRRILTAVPCCHIYGFLFSILLPARLRCEVVDVREANVTSLIRDLRPGDLLVSHPDHWAVIARQAAKFPKDVVGITSTAPCADALALELRRCGLERLLQIYGSSETGGVAWRDSPEAYYELMPFWSRDETGDSGFLKHSLDGVADNHPPPDRLAWHDARHFRILGRVDNAVQVGGVNVYPGRVRQTLMDHPLVNDAAVRLMTSCEGTRLKAFVVPSSDADPVSLPADLMLWTNTRLSPAERPRVYTLGANLPMDEHGKLKDWSIAAPPEDAPNSPLRVR